MRMLSNMCLGSRIWGLGFGAGLGFCRLRLGGLRSHLKSFTYRELQKMGAEAAMAWVPKSAILGSSDTSALDRSPFPTNQNEQIPLA